MATPHESYDAFNRMGPSWLEAPRPAPSPPLPLPRHAAKQAQTRDPDVLRFPLSRPSYTRAAPPHLPLPPRPHVAESSPWSPTVSIPDSGVGLGSSFDSDEEDSDRGRARGRSRKFSLTDLGNKPAAQPRYGSKASVNSASPKSVTAVGFVKSSWGKFKASQRQNRTPYGYGSGYASRSQSSDSLALERTSSSSGTSNSSNSSIRSASPTPSTSSSSNSWFRRSPASSVTSLSSTSSSYYRPSPKPAAQRVLSPKAPKSPVFKGPDAEIQPSLSILSEYAVTARPIINNPNFHALIFNHVSRESSDLSDHYIRDHFPSLRVWMSAEWREIRWRLAEAKKPLAMRSQKSLAKSVHARDTLDMGFCLENEDNNEALQSYALRRVLDTDGWLWLETPAERETRIRFLELRRSRLARGDRAIKLEELEAENAYLAWLRVVDYKQ